jgi:hypothetical protein
MSEKKMKNLDQVKELVFRNGRVIMCEVVSILETLFGSVQSNSKDSQNLHHIATKFMSCLLSKNW